VKTLANGQFEAGAHHLTWNTKDEKESAASAGIYFLKIQAANYVETKKVYITVTAGTQ